MPMWPKRMRWMTGLTVVVLAGAWLLRLPPAQAGAAAPVTLTAQVGFDGYYREGAWLPVRIRVENTGPDLKGRLEISSPAGPAALVTRELDLPTQSRRELFLYFAPDAYTSAAYVSLRIDGQVAAGPITLNLRQLNATDLLYGVWAGTPSAYSLLANVSPAGGQAYVTPVEAAGLPPLAAGWTPLDILVISDVDTGVLTPDQRAALSQWVDAGGRLLVMGGPSWQKTAAGLLDRLPLEPAGARTTSEWTSLTAYAGAAAPPAEAALAATGALRSEAFWLAGTDQAGWAAVRDQGYGQVFYLTADPAFAPLRGWDGTLGVFQQLLSTPVLRPGWADGVTNWSAAQNAVDALPDLQLPSPFLICGFLGLYLILVGPLNYLLLRWLKRRELAWLTIPVIVLVFSLTAYLAGYGLAGDQPTLHVLTVVQSHAGQPQARLSQVIGLFSPRRTTYDVTFAPGWLARPLPSGSGVGPAALQIEQAEQTQLRGVRTEIAGVQSFLAEGGGPAPAVTAALTLDLARSPSQLAGTLTNGAAFALKDAVLLAPGQALPLGDLQAGETRSVSLSFGTGRAAAPASLKLPGPAFGAAAPGTVTDTTPEDILGTPSYYDDRRLFRRYSLLVSAITSARGGGVYLAGWAAAAPAAPAVVNTAVKVEAETLYLIALPASVAPSADVLVLPPGLMTWQALNTPAQSGPAAPYDSSLMPGDTMAFQFRPARPLAFKAVRALALDVAGVSYGPNATLTPEVSLWDFTRAAWGPLGTVSYGRQSIEAPARFVGPGGEIRVQLVNRTPDTLGLTSLEFTLTVEP